MAETTLEPIFLTKRQVAQAIASSERHVDHLTQDGVLTPIRRGRWVRFALDDVKGLRERLATKQH